MTFAWPAMLWLLLLVPLLAAAHVLASRRRQAALRRAASVLRLADAAGRGPGGKRHVPAALFLLAVAVGVVALSRPSAPVLLPGRGGTVILSIDVSGSMRARDIVPSRMEAVRNAARSFARAQPVGVRVGVVAFSSSAFLVQAPTTNRSAVLAAIDRLQPQMFTAIGSALLTALDAIFPPAPEAGSDPTAPLSPLAPAGPPAAAPGSYPSAAIILLSDGQSNQGPDPLDAAQAAALRGVRVFTIGVGTREGTNLSFGGFTFRAILDEATLKKIALLTGGSYFKASNAGELEGIYQTLGSRLQLEKAQTEITAPLLAAALVLLVVMAGLSVAWFNRLL